MGKKNTNSAEEAPLSLKSKDPEVKLYLNSEPRPSKSFKCAFDILESFVYAIVAVLFIFTFFLRLTIVDGPSMENTLKNKEYLVVSNVFFTYEPENGDIVVVHGDFEKYYQSKYGESHKLYHNYSDPIVKRVIAIGGQTIKIDYNTLETFVDGIKINEDYAKFDNFDHTANNLPSLGDYKYDDKGHLIEDGFGNPIYFTFYDPTTNIFEATVPEGHIFVMGDNRDHSADSRISDIGFIPVDFVVGKAIFRLSPFTTF